MKRALQDRQYHFVYRTERLDGSGRYYIGVHSTDDLDDGYLGSGTVLKKSIKRYGIAAHKCTIVEMLPTREAALALEKQMLTEEILSDVNCMNLVPGGGYAKRKPDHKLAALNKAVGLRKFYASHKSVDARRKISQAHTGRRHSAETLQNMRIAAKKRMQEMRANGKWEEVKLKNSLAHIGKMQSAITKAKRTESLKNARTAAGGKFTFGPQARTNISASQIGNEKHAGEWRLLCKQTGNECVVVNLSKWLRAHTATKARTKTGLCVRDACGKITHEIRRV